MTANRIPQKYKRSERIVTMPKLRRRAKKMMRKRYKRTIKLTDLDRVWNIYAEWAINHMIKYGKVNLGNHTVLEIVGKAIIDDPKAFGLIASGIYVTKNGALKPANLSRNRSGIKYKIKVTNKNYKGYMIFEAAPALKKKVSEHLKSSNQYYRIEK